MNIIRESTIYLPTKLYRALLIIVKANNLMKSGKTDLAKHLDVTLTLDAYCTQVLTDHINDEYPNVQKIVDEQDELKKQAITKVKEQLERQANEQNTDGAEN